MVYKTTEINLRAIPVQLIESGYYLPAQEISKLKADINMGKGAVKALIWVGSLLGIIFGLLNLESK